MSPISSLLRLAVLLLVFELINATIVQLRLEDSNGNDKIIYGTSSASIRNTGELELYYPKKEIERLACEELELEKGEDSLDFALLAKRGRCSFEQKAKTAIRVGAKVLIVFNDENSLYNSTTGYFNDPCDLHCSLGSSIGIHDSCESSSKCHSNFCATNPIYSKDVNAEYCCVQEKLITMQIRNKSIIQSIVPIFVGYGDGRKLIKAQKNPDALVTIGLPPRYTFSTLSIMWCAGTSIVMLTTFISQSQSRRNLRYRLICPVNYNVQTEQELEVQPETFEFDANAACFFLVFSSFFLIALFFLVIYFGRQVVLAFIVIFCMSAVFATSAFIVNPFLRVILPSRVRESVLSFRGTAACSNEGFRLVDIFSTVSSAIIVITWFIYRHEEWSWVLLDLIAVAIACLFLSTARVSTLRQGTLLLSIFCLYDIFMTFLTPWLFGGKSVMVEVATAGKGTEKVSTDGQSCERTETERMPMLFLFPGINGEFTMLGFGDILLPGVFICYCLRIDYLNMKLQQQKTNTVYSFFEFFWCHRYYLTTCFAYSIGLLCTIAANAFDFALNGVKGQPALLYLVPFILGAFYARAYQSGELSKLMSSSLQNLEQDVHLSDEENDEEVTDRLVQA